MNRCDGWRSNCNWTENPCVGGSTPSPGTNDFKQSAPILDRGFFFELLYEKGFRFAMVEARNQVYEPSQP